MCWNPKMILLRQFPSLSFNMTHQKGIYKLNLRYLLYSYNSVVVVDHLITQKRFLLISRKPTKWGSSHLIRLMRGQSKAECQRGSSLKLICQASKCKGRGGGWGWVFQPSEKMGEFWEVFSRLVVRDEDESDASESPEEAIINEIFPSKAKRYSDLLF